MCGIASRTDMPPIAAVIDIVTIVPPSIKARRSDTVGKDSGSVWSRIIDPLPTSDCCTFESGRAEAGRLRACWVKLGTDKEAKVVGPLSLTGPWVLLLPSSFSSMTFMRLEEYVVRIVIQ
jgi:hypothetical protein